MREIKFRAWDKIDEKLWNVISIDFIKGEVTLLNEYTKESYIREIDEVELMQYTGLKDKNGKEIYEGDIIKYNFKSLIEKEGINRDRIAPVYWQEFRGCWAVKESKYCNNDLFTYIQNGNVVEVIGNIYENSELLEV